MTLTDKAIMLAATLGLVWLLVRSTCAPAPEPVPAMSAAQVAKGQISTH